MPPLNLSMFSAAGIVLTAILSSAVLSPVVAVERYHLTIPVPSGGGIGGVSAINNRGWLAGISVTNQPYLVHAAIWRDGQMLNAGNLPGGGTQIFAINDSGLVVGSSHNGESGFHQGYLGGVGIAQQLSSLDGSYAQAVGINNLGVAVGWSIEQSPIFGERGRAVLWQGGAAVALPYLNPDSPSAWATDINDMGVVVGRSSNLACRWTGGVASLGTLGGDVSEALAINASGVIVGNSATCPSGGGGGPTSVLSSGGARDCIPYSRAFRYENGAMTELETPEGHDSSANDINDVGQIVGWTMDSESVRAALWVEGGLHWLDELHDGDPGVVLGRALKVNNRGEILCEGGILLTPKRTPVLILPGVAATYASESVDFTHWLFNRGVEPEAMIIDPLGHFYDDMLQTLDNAGYTPGVDLFAATYDWRVVPGPSDGVSDGVVNGISAASITDNSLVCGVDYLGHWLKQAMDAWETAHPGDTLKEVDLIAHSTGGLVARTYIQSAAYGGLLPDGRRLPRVRHLVMMGVPNRGASKPWNPLHDDWNGDLTFQVVLSKILNLAYQKVLGGWTLSGPDGPITAAELQGAPEGPEQRFVRRYAPTIASLLGTYDFLDTGLGPRTSTGTARGATPWCWISTPGWTRS